MTDGPESRQVPLKSLLCQLDQFTRWSPAVSKPVEEDVHACFEGSWEQSWFCWLWRENSKYFLKFYLFTPPGGANYPLFPHQDVVPLIDPCSGFVSPAADAEQQPSVGRATESLVDYGDRKPHQCPHHRGESPPCLPTGDLLEETSQERRWKSRVWLRGKANYFF